MAIPNLSDLLQGIIQGKITPREVFTLVSQLTPTPDPEPLTWDEPEKRLFEYGVSKGILFLMKEDGTYARGQPWTGLTNVTDEPDGADLNKMYADGILYAGIRGSEEYHASIEAFTYPDDFMQCDGTASPIPGAAIGQQNRRKFGLCWRTEIGNGNTETFGYKIHVAYGLTAQPTEKAYDSINNSPEANPFNWSVDGSSVPIYRYKPTVKLEFDSTRLSKGRMEVLEDVLYGAGGSFLPLPNDLLNLVEYAYGSDTIGRQQITGEIDYVKDGVLYRGANAPTILINDESDLEELAPICNPGSFAFNQDMSHMWQLDANETWVRMI